MSIRQALCTSFKKELLEGVHDFTSDTFKLALYTASASLGPETTVYTATGEASGTAYTAGGATATAVAPTTDGTTALVDFGDVTWSTATIVVRGALLYNSTQGNKAVMVLDFGLTITKTAADLLVKMPTADRNNALIRIA
jgi:hypothetical protein